MPDLDLTEEEWAALLRASDETSPKKQEPKPSTGVPTQPLRTRYELDEQFPNQRRDLVCPECGSQMTLKDSRNGVFYGCVRWHETRCKGSHSAHRSTGLPMGIPATANTKKLRMDAHASFDQLWKTGRMKRPEAYAWLSKQLELPPAQTHISMFDDEMCRKVIRVVEREFTPQSRFDLMDEWDGTL